MWRLEAGITDDGDEHMEGADQEDGRQPREKGKWYSEAIEYWSKVDATVDGVLGGYGKVSGIEIAESKHFLKMVRLGVPRFCGSPAASHARGA
eukprot:scaffold1687_cov405-Prasinococcus_capsulatus_cf.AAC.1